MAPTKRSKPAFSPPRPRKVDKASTSKATKTMSTGTKSKKQTAGSKVGTSINTSSSKSKSKSKTTESTSRQRSRLVSPTPSASDSLGDDSANEETSMNIDENNSDDESSEEENTTLTNNPEDSPEPDYILAEVSHEPTTESEPPVPLELIHRILHSQFSNPEKTKISTDAREIVGRYIEVFVREAIMRCAYEKKGDASGSGSESAGQGDGGGWLELEDLEKVAVQLCLDF